MPRSPWTPSFATVEPVLRTLAARRTDLLEDVLRAARHGLYGQLSRRPADRWVPRLPHSVTGRWPARARRLLAAHLAAVAADDEAPPRARADAAALLRDPALLADLASNAPQPVAAAALTALSESAALGECFDAPPSARPNDRRVPADEQPRGDTPAPASRTPGTPAPGTPDRDAADPVVAEAPVPGDGPGVETPAGVMGDSRPAGPGASGPDGPDTPEPQTAVLGTPVLDAHGSAVGAPHTPGPHTSARAVLDARPAPDVLSLLLHRAGSGGARGRAAMAGVRRLLGGVPDLRAVALLAPVVRSVSALVGGRKEAARALAELPGDAAFAALLAAWDESGQHRDVRVVLARPLLARVDAPGVANRLTEHLQEPAVREAVIVSDPEAAGIRARSAFLSFLAGWSVPGTTRRPGPPAPRCPTAWWPRCPRKEPAR
ncbi:hypothetical protein [Streptomyces sp. ME19-01-6]|uniref:hypothetical protein n=1 Tax=Streptomyces sp. ME19-01-6 TaxID=3028686 RepID=UPI0029B06DD7|nr:hypothetical protein [Streptomyces sp. ME19-01-6]MDX3227727.1 hypothetical protein [Streptomyces sp. ME19-01-6]